MKLNRAAAAISGVAVAGVAVVSGVGVTHHQAATAAHSASAAASQVHQVSNSPASRPTSAINRASGDGNRTSLPSAAASPSSPADPSLLWLASPGGQAQVTFNDDVVALAGALEIESHSPTVANHLVFEADARVVRAQAQKILSTPALLPAVNRAAYERMLNAFIVVANLLQPGPGYGTTAQDWAAWDVAMQASNINVS
jgi:hypothetical protein